MPIRKPISQLTLEEARAYVDKHQKQQLERSRKAAAKKKESGFVRLTVYVPEGARERAREAVAQVVREYEKETKFPFDEPEES